MTDLESQDKDQMIAEELAKYPDILKSKYKKVKYLGKGAYGSVILYELINKQANRNTKSKPNFDLKMTFLQIDVVTE